MHGVPGFITHYAYREKDIGTAREYAKYLARRLGASSSDATLPPAVLRRCHGIVGSRSCLTRCARCRRTRVLAGRVATSYYAAMLAALVIRYAFEPPGNPISLINWGE